MTDDKKAAPGGTGTASNATSSLRGHSTKIDRVEAALRRPGGMNRFEAERIGDHCLNSTVARLRETGALINSAWETVPTRYCPRGVRVLRYWIAGRCHE